MTRPQFSRSAVLRGGAAVAAGGIVGDGLGTALNVIFGVELGAEGYGVYAFMLASASVLAVLARFGLNSIMVRDIARSVDPTTAARGTREPVLTSLGITFSLAALLGLVMILGPGAALLDAMGNLDRSMVAGLTVVFIATALYSQSTEALRGMHRLPAASFLGLPVQRLVVLTLVAWIVLFTDERLTATTAIWLTAAAALVALGSSGAFLALQLRELPKGKPGTASAIRMARDGAPLILGELLGIAGNRLPIWVLAGLDSFRDAGVYALAFAFVTLVGIAQRIQRGTLAPFVASSYHAGDRDSLERRLRVTAAATSVIAITGSIVLLALGTVLVPRVFGAEFDDTVTVAAILLLGSAVVVLAGPCSLLLNVSGNQRWSALSSVVSVSLAAAAIFPAADFGGSIGAAIVMATATSIQIVMCSVFARRRTGIVTTADFAGLYRSLRTRRR